MTVKIKHTFLIIFQNNSDKFRIINVHVHYFFTKKCPRKELFKSGRHAILLTKDTYSIC